LADDEVKRMYQFLKFSNMLLFYFTYTEELSVTDVLKHIFQKAARCEKRGERYREEDRERESENSRQCSQ